MILPRHGESAFNVAYQKSRIDPGLEDPPLTETGRAQARAAETVADMGARRVITSPCKPSQGCHMLESIR